MAWTKEQWITYGREYRAANRERLRALHAAWRASNKDKVRAMNVRRYEKVKACPEKWARMLDYQRNRARAKAAQANAANAAFRDSFHEKYGPLIAEANRLRKLAQNRKYSVRRGPKRLCYPDTYMAYYEKNREKIRESSALWNARNPGANKERAARARARKAQAAKNAAIAGKFLKAIRSLTASAIEPKAAP